MEWEANQPLSEADVVNGDGLQYSGQDGTSTGSAGNPANNTGYQQYISPGGRVNIPSPGDYMPGMGNFLPNPSTEGKSVVLGRSTLPVTSQRDNGFGGTGLGKAWGLDTISDFDDIPQTRGSVNSPNNPSKKRQLIYHACNRLWREGVRWF